MWYNLVDNQMAISHLYRDVPPLQQVEIISLVLERRGPTLSIHMNLPKFAELLPKRWLSSWNTVQIQLDFIGISDFSLHGFSIDPWFDLYIEREAKGFLIKGDDKDCQISFLCEHIYVQKVTGYTKQVDGM